MSFDMFSSFLAHILTSRPPGTAGCARLCWSFLPSDLKPAISLRSPVFSSPLYAPLPSTPLLFFLPPCPFFFFFFFLVFRNQDFAGRLAHYHLVSLFLGSQQKTEQNKYLYQYLCIIYLFSHLSTSLFIYFKYHVTWYLQYMTSEFTLNFPNLLI